MVSEQQRRRKIRYAYRKLINDAEVLNIRVPPILSNIENWYRKPQTPSFRASLSRYRRKIRDIKEEYRKIALRLKFNKLIEEASSLDESIPSILSNIENWYRKPQTSSFRASLSRFRRRLYERKLYNEWTKLMKEIEKYNVTKISFNEYKLKSTVEDIREKIKFIYREIKDRKIRIAKMWKYIYFRSLYCKLRLPFSYNQFRYFFSKNYVKRLFYEFMGKIKECKDIYFKEYKELIEEMRLYNIRERLSFEEFFRQNVYEHIKQKVLRIRKKIKERKEEDKKRLLYKIFLHIKKEAERIEKWYLEFTDETLRLYNIEDIFDLYKFSLPFNQKMFIHFRRIIMIFDKLHEAILTAQVDYNNFILLSYGLTYFTLSVEIITKIIRDLRLRIERGQYSLDVTGSEISIITLFIKSDFVEFHNVIYGIKRKFKKRRGGAFFSYYHNLPICLKRYGIFKDFNDTIYDSNELMKKIESTYKGKKFTYNPNKYEFKCNDDEKMVIQIVNLFDEEYFDFVSREYTIFMHYSRYEDNCLLIALKNSGKINNEQYEYLKSMVKNRKIPNKDLKIIAEKLRIKIKLLRHDSNGKKLLKTYGKNHENMIKIGLINDHYFIVDNETNIYRYALENYDKLKDKENFNLYCAENVLRKTASKRNTFINSFDLISYMMEHKEKFLRLISYRDLIYTQFNYKKRDFTTLKYDKSFIMMNANNKKEKTKKLLKVMKSNNGKVPDCLEKNNLFYKDYDIEFFDIETTTNGNYHKPYLVCSYNIYTKKNKTFYGEDCCNKLLETFKKDTLLIAHNAGYDFRGIMKYLICINGLIERSNRLMIVSGLYFNRKMRKMITIKIKDSYSLIPEPLRNFNKCFRIPIKKEIMPYEIYTEESVRKENFDIDEALKYIKTDEDKKCFINNINEWGLLCDEKNKFDHKKYSEKYCEMDVKVLKDGFMKFFEWMKDITGLNIFKKVSLASLTHDFFTLNNVYEGCFEINGVPREFIQKTIVGGRVMSNSNKKYIFDYEDNIIMEDFDAVSLYPSAMVRLSEIGGYLKGLPIPFENMSYDELRKKDGYFVEINITEIGKKRGFPLISYIDEKTGVRNYTNERLGKYYVDKITLEDYIEFHNIKFTIIRGYYFNNGRNDTIKRIILKLFIRRLDMKEIGNPIQRAYKLCMNSSYGKTIMKPIETSKVFFDNKEDTDKFIRMNYNFIKEINKLRYGDKYCIKKIKPIVDHYSMPHIGSEILSMSKRIMNKVMCLAEDIGCKIYYQDTDSMHIVKKDLKKLAEHYKIKYGKELIGKGLGQFHGDFDDTIDEIGAKADEVYAMKSIILGKKCYYDELIQLYKGKQYHKHHIRMKGVPRKCVEIRAKELGISVYDLYKKLYNGETIEFDLLKAGVKFEYLNDYTIINRKDFIRKISFK